MSRSFVRLYKDGDRMGVETNVTEPDEYLALLSEAFASVVESGVHDGDWEFQFRYWLVSAFDILSKLKGYKSNVYEEHILRAGAVMFHPSSLAYSTIPVGVHTAEEGLAIAQEA